ncbi:hypothetical protein ACHQM5_010365 [Ranunculus cassubicifolius]
MSISPTHAHRSNSSAALSQSPTSNHGFLQSPHTDFRSPQISDHIVPLSDSTGSTGGDGGSSSKKVTDMRKENVQRNSHRHLTGNHFQHHSAGRGISSSQIQNDQFGYAQPIGELSGARSSLQNQPNSRTVGFHGGVTNATTKKNQTTNANHLLNFQYDRISRPPQRTPPPRRQQKIRPYNKDLFLQANFRFVLLDSGNYSPESMDADKMLQWEDVICVRYSTPYPVQCPICLESPLCPQITSCGHIFCFPCILRYLLMGKEDHKGDCWKKCPLCFMMISLKDLYTIYIENVKHHQPGDNILFTLLTRQKGSLIPYQKNLHGTGSIDCNNVENYDNFSKFSLTSDVELSVGKAYSELKDWLVKADSGLVDDLQQLPYVSAALEQLDQRKKFWTEVRSLTSNPPLGNSPPNVKACEYSSKIDFMAPSSTANDAVDSGAYASSSPTPCVSQNNKSKWFNPEKSGGEESVPEISKLLETCEGGEKSSSSYEEGSIGSRHINEKDAYSFYQAVDGQNLILHPLNMKCLLQHYGSYDLLPPRISGKILQLETVTQTEVMRRRYRYLSHFTLTTTFQLCEIDLSEILPSDALLPFMDEIKKRENHRKRITKKEHQERVKAEEVSLLHDMPGLPSFGYYPVEKKSFSMDDFEALGSAPVPSTSPLTSEMKRFSDVTRLGFAAAHDSPSLKNGEESNHAEERGETSGPTKVVTMSFANIISQENRESPKNMVVGKKGKKQNRVLLSTAGGRRY